MVDTHTHDQMCQQHDKPTAVYEGFKVTVMVRGKQRIRYCHRECLKSLIESVEVINFEPFAVSPNTKEIRRQKLSRYRKTHRSIINAYRRKWYHEHKNDNKLIQGGENGNLLPEEQGEGFGSHETVLQKTSSGEIGLREEVLARTPRATEGNAPTNRYKKKNRARVRKGE